ncbi:hypothetical protein V1477_001510 [Vespula maculifrons]|uniref:Uncharacterized protein n=1 Tax=Vespula maculifrons TaxID=7453 RepID=A0ABD2CYQ8_VESMC
MDLKLPKVLSLKFSPVESEDNLQIHSKVLNLYIVLVGLNMLEDKLSSDAFQFHFDLRSICNVGQPFNRLFDSNPSS